MSWIEVSLFALLIITLILLIINPFKKVTPFNYLAVATFAMMLSQMMYEMVRWQLYPTYFVVSMLFMSALIQLRAAKSATNKKLPNNREKQIIVITIALLFSGSAMYAFPNYAISEPLGNYKIGTSTIEMTDTSRTEIYGDTNGDKRRIKVQFWYPAEVTKGFTRVKWLQDGLPVARALAKEMNLPFFTLDHTAKVMSHAFKDAPISEALEQYPIIVMSHGWTGFRNLHTDIAELLASHGYIVIGIDHTYGAQVVVFDENDIALLDHSALPDRDSTPDFLEYANRLVSTYAGDVQYVLDQLPDFNEGRYSTQFINKLNLNTIGLIGHSTGGGADVMATIEGAPVRALLGLDAWVEPIAPELVEKGLNIPTLFLRSGQWEEGYNNANLLKIVSTNANSKGLIQINGATHIDFSMAHMYSRLTEFVGFTGTIEQERLSQMQHELILNFFEATMRDDEVFTLAPMLEKWDELEIINP